MWLSLFHNRLIVGLLLDRFSVRAAFVAHHAQRRYGIVPTALLSSSRSNASQQPPHHAHHPPSSSNPRLRNATIDDLEILLEWDTKEHIQASIGDYDFNDWNWQTELPRNDLSWRFQLMAELPLDAGGALPIGFVQIIDPALEETHYWGCNLYEPHQYRAIDIWIGNEHYIGQGYGSAMMHHALRGYCFREPSVQYVLVDPMSHNVQAHRFYQRLGFQPIGERFFGPDQCLVHQLSRSDYDSAAAGGIGSGD